MPGLPESKRNELDALVGLIFDRDQTPLQPDERDRLNQLLRDDDAAQRHYLELVRQDGMLRDRLQRSQADAEPAFVEPTFVEEQAVGGPLREGKRTGERTGWRSVGIARLAAACGIFASGALAALLIGRSVTAAARPWTVQAVGTVVAADAGVWDQNIVPLEVGAPLFLRSSFTLSKGAIEIEMRDGARVTVEAPCKMHVLGPNEIRIERGAVLVDAGVSTDDFIIRTNSMRVVDLGTVFAVQADPDGTDGVAVFDGLVRVDSPLLGSDDQVTLTTGHAFVVRPSTVTSRADLIRGRFGGVDRDAIARSGLQSKLRGILSQAAPRQLELNQNIVINGGAEIFTLVDPGSPNAVADFFGWHRIGDVFHNLYRDFPLETKTMPDAGESYFFGGTNERSTLSQRVELGFAEQLIDAGRCVAEVSALLGGYLFFGVDDAGGVNFDAFNLHDPASIVVTLFDASLNEIARASLGPVALDDLDVTPGPTTIGNAAAEMTRLIELPPGTRSAKIDINFGRTSGRFTNGIADNVRLVLRHVDDAGIDQHARSDRH